MYKFIKSNKGSLFFLALVCALVFSMQILVVSKNLSDPDGYYHVKMAKLVAQGKVDSSFDWLPFTTWGDSFANQHLLYHWFLNLFPGESAFLLSAAVSITIFLIAFYVALRSMKVSNEWLWILLILASSSDFLFRINLIKANSLSLALLCLIIVSLYKNRYWLVAPLSFLFVWTYGGFVLLPLVGGSYGLSLILIRVARSSRHPEQSEGSNTLTSGEILRSAQNDKKENGAYLKHIVSPLAYCIVGIGLGLVLHPQFPEIINHLYIQVVDVMTVKKTGVIIGGEWYPYEFIDFISINGLTLLVWLIGLAALFFGKRPNNKQRQHGWWLALMSAGLFVLTVLSKRFVEYWVPFAILFAAFSLDPYIRAIPWRDLGSHIKRYWQVAVASGLVVLILGSCIFYNIKITIGYLRYGSPFDGYRNAAEYIKASSQPGDIVFNTQWDQFPQLFYWADQNRYIIGMDPTFMYVKNKDLYWKWRAVTEHDREAWENDKAYRIIHDDFGARYIFIEHERNENLMTFLREPAQAVQFIERYDDGINSVFEVK